MHRRLQSFETIFSSYRLANHCHLFFDYVRASVNSFKMKFVYVCVCVCAAELKRKQQTLRCGLMSHLNRFKVPIALPNFFFPLNCVYKFIMHNFFNSRYFVQFFFSVEKKITHENYSQLANENIFI